MVSSMVLICTCKVCQTVSSSAWWAEESLSSSENSPYRMSESVFGCDSHLQMQYGFEMSCPGAARGRDACTPMNPLFVFLLFLSPISTCFHASGLSLRCTFGWVYFVALVEVLWTLLDERFVTVICFARTVPSDIALSSFLFITPSPSTWHVYSLIHSSYPPTAFQTPVEITLPRGIWVPFPHPSVHPCPQSRNLVHSSCVFIKSFLNPLII